MKSKLNRWLLGLAIIAWLIFTILFFIVISSSRANCKDCFPNPTSSKQLQMGK